MVSWEAPSVRAFQSTHFVPHKYEKSHKQIPTIRDTSLLCPFYCCRVLLTSSRTPYWSITFWRHHIGGHGIQDMGQSRCPYEGFGFNYRFKDLGGLGDRAVWPNNQRSLFHFLDLKSLVTRNSQWR